MYMYVGGFQEVSGKVNDLIFSVREYTFTRYVVAKYNSSLIFL